MHIARTPASFAIAFTAVVSLFASSARAESRMEAQAKDYAAKNQLPVRKVVAPGPGQTVERLFVPVLKHTYDDFRGRLVDTNGGIAIRALDEKYDRNAHVIVGIEAGTAYIQARNQGAAYASSWMHHSHGGYLFGVDLADEEIAHLKTQIKSLGPESNCMMWLSSAEVAPGKLLYHALGVSRSRGAGAAIRKKLLRVSNERVKVAGVIVNTLEEFNAMTDAQLLGPAHPNGDAEAVHQ